MPIAEASNAQVIAYYHQLWHVEQSFRMSKSDLKARPIFHRTQDAIEAHLTVVMAALAIQRSIERDSGLSPKRVVKTLRPIRSGVITLNGEEYPVEPDIPLSVRPLLRKLRKGY